MTKETLMQPRSRQFPVMFDYNFAGKRVKPEKGDDSHECGRKGRSEPEAAAYS
jgi:hypothetical protein